MYSDILPRDGRQITYKQLSYAIQHAFNLAPTLADQLTASAKLLDQGRGWIDLHDLNALNVSREMMICTSFNFWLTPSVKFLGCPTRCLDHPSRYRLLSRPGLPTP